VPPRHSVQNQWDLLAPLGIGAPEIGQPPVEMPADDEASATVRRRLGAAGVGDRDRIVVMHVSAGNPFRRWPPEHFARVAAELARRDASRRIIITSGPSESDAADAIATTAQHLAGDAAAGIVRCGEFDLSELRALVARAALFVGGDSGPLHVAATTETPIVGLFGPTLAARSAPWRDPDLPFEAVEPGVLPCRPCNQRTCTPGDFRCLTSISTDRVADAAERMLAWRAPTAALKGPRYGTAPDAALKGPRDATAPDAALKGPRDATAPDAVLKRPRDATAPDAVLKGKRDATAPDAAPKGPRYVRRATLSGSPEGSEMVRG
jgi:ADP-heptose:LPS heptosyltransferase